MSDSVFKLTSQSHDRLFGVHGILKAAGVELPDPDYTTPVHTSCWQYASALLKQKNCSGVLGYIHCLRPRPDIPTWVPDWSSERLPFMSDGLKIQRSASYDLQVLSDDRQLLVRGVIVDKVAERARLSFIRPEGTELNEDLGITRPLLGDTQLYTALWNIFAILSVVQLLRQRFDADLANIEAVTVLDLLFGTEQDFTPFIGNGTWHALKEYVEKVLTWRLAYIAGQSSESLASEIEDLVHVPQKLSAVEFARHMAAHPGRIPLENLSAYKTAVRLQSGRVGMAPHSVRAGDEVIMYVGADCPAIIRRVDDGSHSDGSQPRYQWVASAYIRGFMECDVLPQDRERLEYLLFE